MSVKEVPVTIWFGTTGTPPLRMLVPPQVRDRLKQHEGGNQKVEVRNGTKRVEKIDFSEVSRVEDGD